MIVPEIKNRFLHADDFGPHILKGKNALEDLNRIIAGKAGVCPGDSVLAAGCSPDCSAIWLGTAYPDIDVHGISLWPQQIDAARKAAGKKSLKRVRFSVDNHCKTRFPDAHFTLIWACEGLCRLPQQKVDFYKEAYRILKPGGRLVIADGIRKSRMLPPQDELFFRQLLAAWPCSDLDTWEEHYKNAVRVGFSRFQIQDMRPLLEQALIKCMRSEKRGWPLWKMLKIKSKNSSRNLLSAGQQYEAFQKGLWTYGLVFAIKPKDAEQL